MQAFPVVCNQASSYCLYIIRFLVVAILLTWLGGEIYHDSLNMKFEIVRQEHNFLLIKNGITRRIL